MEDQEACVILGLDNIEARKVSACPHAPRLMRLLKIETQNPLLTFHPSVDVQKNVRLVPQVVQ
jgi:hypothetical protein